MIANAPHRQPADHLLVFDIGNTSTTVGSWVKDDIRASETIPHGESGSLADVVINYWDALGDGHKAALACSVVPDRLDQLRSVVSDLTGEALLVVGESLPLPLTVKMGEPNSVGQDRLCSAAAAHLIEGQACVIADFGSAITVDYVDDEGSFIGGAILPGLQMQAEALATHTALLPRVSIEKPSSPLGYNTEQAIRAGIFYGSVGAVRSLVESYASMLERWPVTLLTGGDAHLVAEALEVSDRVVPFLCLRGVVLAYTKSFGAR